MAMTKKDLIEKYRDINVHENWWDCEEENLKQDLAEQGFRLSGMYFSGFWSQGDGACFTGRITDWAKFCEKVPEFVQNFPNTAIFLQDEGGEFTIAHTGRYYHPYSTSHDYNAAIADEVELLSIIDDAMPEDGIESVMRLAMYRDALEEGDVGDWLKDHFRDMMHDLYRTLEEEYNHLTSDEVVWETILANEWNNDPEEDDANECDKQENGDFKYVGGSIVG
jgi:hypothetical protein